MTIYTKILKKIGIIQIFVGVGFMIYGNVVYSVYSPLYVGFGAILIFIAIIYYFGN